MWHVQTLHNSRPEVSSSTCPQPPFLSLCSTSITAGRRISVPCPRKILLGTVHPQRVTHERWKMGGAMDPWLERRYEQDSSLRFKSLHLSLTPSQSLSHEMPMYVVDGRSCRLYLRIRRSRSNVRRADNATGIPQRPVLIQCWRLCLMTVKTSTK